MKNFPIRVITRFRQLFVLFGFLLLAMSPTSAQQLDDSWTVSVYGRSVQVNPDGSYLIPNIVLLDDFGRNQQERFDGLSDDFIRLTGFQIKDGSTQFVQSNFFQLERNAGGVSIRPENLIFKNTPISSPEFIRVVPAKSILTTAGETTQVTTTAFAADRTASFSDNIGTDVTPRSAFTTYRSTNSRIASIDQNGIVTAHSRGLVYLIAIHDSISASSPLEVRLPITTIVLGRVTDTRGNVLAGVNITIDDLPGSAFTDSRGRFQFGEVPVPGDGSPITLRGSAPDGRMIVWTADPIPDGVTDTGRQRLPDLPASLFGLVQNQDGAPVFGATVEVQGRDLTVETDDTGRFQIADDFAGTQITLLISAPGLRPASRQVTPVANVATDIGTTTLEFRSTTLVGIVTDSGGNPFQDVTITIQEKPETANTGADGRFSIADLRITEDSEMITITAEAIDGRMLSRTVNAVDDGETNYGTLKLPDRSTTIRGLVQSANGGAIPGADVTVTIDGEPIMVFADATGAFEVPGVPSNSPTEVTIITTAGGFQAATTTAITVPDGITEAGIITLIPFTNQGTDFIIAFQENSDSLEELKLFVSADAEATVSISGPMVNNQTRNVVPGTVTQIGLDKELSIKGSGNVEQKGIRVTSTEPISLYGVSRRNAPNAGELRYASTDAYTAIPVTSLGTIYRAMSYSHSLRRGSDDVSQLAIVATENDTTVSITPRTAAAGLTAGQSLTFQLDSLETYQLQTVLGAEDLTGALITSDKPIAVFVGNRCADIPANEGFCDHIIEQLPPVETWGSEYVTSPLLGRTSGDRFRILAHQDATIVTFTDLNGATEQLNLEAGSFEEIQIASNQAIKMVSNKPILVAQFSQGSETDRQNGDPFMMLLQPTEQFQRRYTFATVDSPNLPDHRLNVLANINDAKDGKVTINGTVIPPEDWTELTELGLSLVRRDIAEGDYTVEAENPCAIYVYGFGEADSYGYPGGFGLSTE